MTPVGVSAKGASSKSDPSRQEEAIDLNRPGGSGEPPYLNGRVVRCSLTGNNIAFFAVQIDVETLAFDFRRDPQPDRGAHHQCNY